MTATIHRIDSRAVSDERRAQSIVRNAWAAFRSDLQDAAVLSDLMRERLLEALEAISDQIPSDQAFDEAINDLKRGYL